MTTSTASAPAFSACCESSIASVVEFEPAPAITGTRPLASSMHHSTTCLCSSWLSVGLSPVVPTGTRPLVPSVICQLTKARNAASSSEPFLKGVTRAVNDPRKFVLAAMDFLQRTGFARQNRQIERSACDPKRSFIPGLVTPAKGRAGDSGPDFAAVMAQTAVVSDKFSILSTYSIK